jgi:hypothetical protein
VGGWEEVIAVDMLYYPVFHRFNSLIKVGGWEGVFAVDMLYYPVFHRFNSLIKVGGWEICCTTLFFTGLTLSLNSLIKVGHAFVNFCKFRINPVFLFWLGIIYTC